MLKYIFFRLIIIVLFYSNIKIYENIFIKNKIFISFLIYINIFRYIVHKKIYYAFL